MGSDSDLAVMSKAADVLDKRGVDYEMTIISAHREPDVFFEYAKSAEAKGFKVIIAGAGMDASTALSVAVTVRIFLNAAAPFYTMGALAFAASYFDGIQQEFSSTEGLV